MRRIRIKNFGPIKEGFSGKDAWMDIKKVTVFIGNQGSGKSTVAKLISTFMWMEKAIIRGDLQTPVNYSAFIELLSFHRMEDYVDSASEIEYEGSSLLLKYLGNQGSDKACIEVKSFNNSMVLQPKIMYVPAERNFLSSIENINKVSNLIVGSLQNYAVEFRNAQLSNHAKQIVLPVNETNVIYDSNYDENYLVFDNKKLKLSHASSGFHSLVPLFWVTQYLSEFIKQDEKKLIKLLNTDQTVRRNNDLKELNDSSLDENTIRENEKIINAKYLSKYLVNIVEEPEQNLFPDSQHSLLNSLLSFNQGNNMLIITTHSPYLINYLTLAVKADMVNSSIKSTTVQREKLNQIIPLNSMINAEDLVIYEMGNADGNIHKLPDYKGLPSDENFLNSGLEDSNELFAKLQEIEKGWQ